MGDQHASAIGRDRQVSGGMSDRCPAQDRPAGEVDDHDRTEGIAIVVQYVSLGSVLAQRHIDSRATDRDSSGERARASE